MTVKEAIEKYGTGYIVIYANDHAPEELFDQEYALSHSKHLDRKVGNVTIKFNSGSAMTSIEAF